MNACTEIDYVVVVFVNIIKALERVNKCGENVVGAVKFDGILTGTGKHYCNNAVLDFRLEVFGKRAYNDLLEFLFRCDVKKNLSVTAYREIGGWLCLLEWSLIARPYLI